MFRLRTSITFIFATLLAACASEGAPVGEVIGDVTTAPARTMEGTLGAGGLTGFQVSAPVGPEDHEVLAVDLSTLRIPGSLLVGRTLRITGKVDRRVTGTLPNGSQIFQEVLIANELVERSAQRVTMTGTLEPRDGGMVLVERIPADAAPEDQSVVVTALEGLSALPPNIIIGQRVTIKGVSAKKHVGAINGQYLVSNELVIVDDVQSAP
jgi:hypothetical protein